MTTLIPKFEQTGSVTNRAINLKLEETISVKDFGAIGDGVADDTVAIQSALTYLDTIDGGALHIPAGTYKCSDTLDIYPNTLIYGDGREVSTFSFTNADNGIQSLSPINSSTAVNVQLSQIGLVCTNVSNTGGGFFDLGGSYVSVRDCFIQGFGYGIIFDQTEIADVQFNNIVGNTIGQIWLVDGPAYTPDVLLGFTNGVVIYGNQLNALSTADLIIDDGYAQHYIAANNLNGGRYGIRAYRAAACSIIGNNFEGNAGYSLLFAETNSKGQTPTVLNPDAFKTNANITISQNSIGSSANAPLLYLSNIQLANVVGNIFYAPNCTTNLIEFANPNTAVQITVANNIKNFSQKPWFAAGIFNALQQKTNYLTQLEYTRCQTAASGQYTDTPDSMQGIYIGSKLWVVNANGTNGELVTVENISSTEFITTYATSKSNPHYVTVIDNSNITGTLDNSGTPSVYLATPAKSFLTGGTTAITNFIDGDQGQIITIIGKHSVTITNNANILLAGGVNFAMTSEDTLTLILRPNISGAKWVEMSRSVN
jgi:hypothetical protein